MRVNAIIFTKDRAMQLNLLLESIKANAPESMALNVIYKASSEEYKAGYDKLAALHPDVSMIEETSFKEQVLELMSTPGFDYTCFFVDDDIIYKPFDINKCLSVLEGDDDVFCFSLRLGKNVKVCYTMQAENVLRGESIEDDIMKWNWSVHYLDFGYPLSVDGHIFRAKEILKLTKKVHFNNPNTFEGGLQVFDNYPREKMASFLDSVLVNSPSNIVNDTHPNRSGTEPVNSPKALNDAFLGGGVIDLSIMNFSNIVGCHQELDYPILNTK